MASWKKLLQAMIDDPVPRNYTYDDAARILRRLDFEEPSSRSGSHRLWRRRAPDGNLAVIGLVDKGHGPMKPGYIRDMVKTLRERGLLPVSLEADDDLDN
jgi:hypothetical protein